MKSLLFIGLLAAGAYAGILGPCPARNGAELDYAKYAGTWYLAASMGIMVDVMATKCDSSVMTYDAETGSIGFTDTAYAKVGGVQIQFNSTATPQADRSLMVTSTDGLISAPYWILETDYENFSIVTSCSEKKVGPATFHAENGYILTRQRYPTMAYIPVEVTRSINEALEKNKLDRKSYNSFDNTNCPDEE